MASDRAIRALISEFRGAWNAHDAGRLAGVFAEDALYTSWRGNRAGGRVGVRAHHSAGFQGMFKDSVLTVDGLKIRDIRPDVAAVDVWWSMTGARDNAGAVRPPSRGLMALVVTRENAEPWRILVFHNREIPSDAPGPAQGTTVGSVG
ncbi:MAG: SgcJ/EcaC family oxidoreductase [Thermoplasmata archaeon]|nr:SgcJ/EcaC family oxidoreductase [Thermoplasmata archaeon]